MCKVICVTNRALCGEDFFARIERIAAARPDAILLREKDLPEAEYTSLAGRVVEICRRYDTACILHSYAKPAAELGAACLHLPLPVLRRTAVTAIPFGVSCHSAEEAQEAAGRGARYLIAGHIYETDCKKGLPGRGVDYLREVCRSVEIPVYAIGGITPENVPEVLRAGAGASV